MAMTEARSRKDNAMRPSPFRYTVPTSLNELISQLADSGEEAMLLAGGQSLIPMLKLRLFRPSHLIDLGGLSELTGIRSTQAAEEPSGLVLGAMTRHAQVAESPQVLDHCPLLAAAAASIGDPHVRHRGTIGGNICHGDSSGAFPVAAMALDAVLTVAGPEGTRHAPAREFFIDFLTTDLGPDEFLMHITVPARATLQGWAFLDLRQRRLDLPILVVAVQLQASSAGVIEQARIVLGGSEAVPLRVQAAEAAVTGQAPGEVLARVAEPLIRDAVEPKDNDLASADYQREMAGVFGRRALIQAMARLTNGRIV
jgi:carbon-monoxide dehydrogenase medium subunit